MRLVRSARAWIADTISGGNAARSTSRSSAAACCFRSWVVTLADLLRPSPDACRHEARLGDADERFLHQERDRRDGVEALLLEPAIDRRLVGSDGGEHP